MAKSTIKKGDEYMVTVDRRVVRARVLGYDRERGGWRMYSLETGRVLAGRRSTRELRACACVGCAS